MDHPGQERWEAAHRELSEDDWRFRRLASSSPELLARGSFAELDEPDSVLFYPLQAWPTFADGDTVAELERMAVDVGRLVRCLPQRVFDGDPAALDRFYGIGNPLLTQLLFEPPDGSEGAISRGDFIRTDDGFRCLEINVVANLGGWESGHVAGKLLANPHVRQALDDLGLAVRHVDPARVLFGHVLERAAGLEPAPDGQVDVALMLPSGRTDVERKVLARHLHRVYQQVLACRGDAVGGRVLVVEPTDLVVDGGVLRRGHRRVHAVIEMYLGETRPDLYRCFKAGAVHLYNGPLARFLSDKRNLALLSDPEASPGLRPDERRWVERHVPWTRLAAPVATVWDGREVYLPELAVEERGELVLKRGQSGGGKGVHIGRFTEPEAWAARVEEAIADGRWVLQRWVESRPYLFQHGTSGCSAHEVVWGPFAFGDRYGGTSLRVQPVDAGAAVNLSLAASEGVLLEVVEPDVDPVDGSCYGL